MNTDQIFEEIQNDYLCIQEEYQELDNLIYKYNNLNYAFEEVSVQLEAINKFGLSDETNYFINKDNYLIENNYIAEEDLYDKNKVIVTLEGILSTIIDGILYIIKKIKKIVLKIIDFILDIVKKIFNISDDTDKKIEKSTNELNNINKDKEENDQKKKDILDKIKKTDIEVNNFIYDKVINIKNLDPSDVSRKVMDEIVEDLRGIINIELLLEQLDRGYTNFIKYLDSDSKDILLDIQNNRYDCFINIYDSLNLMYYPINRKSFQDHIHTCFTRFDETFVRNKYNNSNKYYNEHTVMFGNSIDPKRPFIFNSYIISKEFKKIINFIVKIEKEVNLINDKIVSYDKDSNISIFIDDLIHFHLLMKSINEMHSEDLERIEKLYKKTSKEFESLMNKIEKLSENIKKSKKDDKISTDEFLKIGRYYQNFMGHIINNLKVNNVFVLKELGSNTVLKILGSDLKSLNNIVIKLDKIIKGK